MFFLLLPLPGPHGFAGAPGARVCMFVRVCVCVCACSVSVSVAVLCVFFFFSVCVIPRGEPILSEKNSSSSFERYVI